MRLIQKRDVFNWKQDSCKRSLFDAVEKGPELPQVEADSEANVNWACIKDARLQRLILISPRKHTF